MNIADIESQLRDLVDQPFDPAEFPFAFLTIYDAAKATVTKLRQGAANQAKLPGDVLLKNKLFFRPAPAGRAAAVFDGLATDPLIERHHPRFLLVSDGVEVLARDTKADQQLDAAYLKLNDTFDFFLPLAGIERYEGVAENPADIKATGRLAKLYDSILEGDPDWLGHHGTHELNLFMTRMLFCFFSEDTGIFPEALFTSTVLSLTKEDGSDTSEILAVVFRAMNTQPQARAGLPEYAIRFPYVNGGLFREETAIPTLSKRARRLFKECGDLNWRDINPDIFGSMIQAVVEPGLRGDMGMHYTSVPNIMKVLQPLFLTALEEEFELSRESESRLNKLLQRLYNIRIFDPACGSGNFLIIAYRELRRLETRIFQRRQEIAKQRSLPMSGIQLNQFYGIELADFAAETAKLSLWIAEYQLNAQFKEVFGSAPPALPLHESGAVRQGNALRIDWNEICPRRLDRETYLVGNPPYLGRGQQSADQKRDMALVFAGVLEKFRMLDFASCWIVKATQYASDGGASFAFVTTNSICQGEQVRLLWPLVFSAGLEIGFAYQSFKWRNNAAHNAGVSCVVVGIRNAQKSKKLIYSGEQGRVVSGISPYLLEGSDLIVEPDRKSASGLPKIHLGNMSVDGGNLILSADEARHLCEEHAEARKYLRRLYGSQEFIKGIERYCLWIENEDVASACLIPEISRRIEAVRQMRLDSIDPGAQRMANRPHQFREMNKARDSLLIVPRVSSEERRYLPCGILGAEVAISDLAYAIYDPPDYLLAVLSSRLHQLWTRVIGGQLETRLRYSNTLVYNTFPIPSLSTAQKERLSECSVEILMAREASAGKTIAWLYDPKTMPSDLQVAHETLDQTIEEIYAGAPMRTDEERLERLFKLYAIKTRREREAGRGQQSRMEAVS
jgi:hypothetical protein